MPQDTNPLIGPLAGDIIGSVHEFGTCPAPGFPLFSPSSHYTDDSLLTLATARCLLEGGDYAHAYREAWRAEPRQGWGARFRQWAASNRNEPYGSFGNGSAMRVSPVAYWHADEAAVIEAASASAAVTHDHPEGIKGARATAQAIVRARHGETPAQWLAALAVEHDYDLATPLVERRVGARFDETCQGTVPVALRVAAEASSFEEAMRLALSIEADSDTLACIAGGIAQARFGVPDWVGAEVRRRLRPEHHAVLEAFGRAVGPVG